MQSKNQDSFFLSELKKSALKESIAAPANIQVLTQNLSYLSTKHLDLVREAHNFASDIHQGQKRRTGHPYITHPSAVALILSEMKMDHETIMAALLHDVIEDSEINKSILGKQFGSAVSEIVDGVSKLSKIFESKAQAQAENFQKMALAMAKDIRVILVKIADRLHNMRTIGVMSTEQRRRIAKETLDFYAPIANRLGMNNIKNELEELAFQALYPLRAESITKAVSSRSNKKELMNEVTVAILAALNREGINAEVHGRQKNAYSIYRKMKAQRKSFSEIMDVFGIRIIVDQVDSCYRALGVVHNLYKPVPTRFKDYISIPKINGYQSLHTSLFTLEGAPLEVQIRTKQMAAVADNGIAGHWLYKVGDENSDSSQKRAHQWVQELLELQKRAGNPMEFIEHLKVDLFADEVYVFTPQGEIMELPRGACAIDFAYAVHTDIGNRCVACRVDRSLAPLSMQLESGQSVEIISSDDARPNPDWLTFVVTSKARSAIRMALKNQKESESIGLGRKLLNRALANANTSISKLDFRRLRKVFNEMGVRRLNDLLSAIGNGDLMAYVAAQKLLAADNPDYEAVTVEGGGPVAIRGGEGLIINYGRCCGPVPGDPIVGHMTPGKGLVIHIESCPNINEFRKRASREIIPARWTSKTEGEFQTALRVNASRRKGILALIASEISDAEAGLEAINTEERNAEVSTIDIALTVKNRSHLARVMRRLRNEIAVINISRKGQ
ncbi:RelA/SpoT family protein [Gammaproteobacteria bacterium]|nr:RelA/SpoT family protein [Gammaproteobacteria bacterium]